MSENTPDPRRWGGPGSSDEDASRPMPAAQDPRAPGEPTNTPYSHVSGGGGERDRRHGHDAEAKRRSQESSEDRAKP